jgi:plasmid stability protein
MVTYDTLDTNRRLRISALSTDNSRVDECRNPHSEIGGKVMATINLRNVPDELHRKAKARAAMEGVSLKQLILRLLEDYLEGVC